MKADMGISLMSDWPATFFDGSNQWDFTYIDDCDFEPDLKKELLGLIELAVNGRLPFVLPRLYLDEDIYFYLVADNLKQLGELREIIQAYFGNTYFEFFHQIHTNSEDPLETKLLEKHNAGFLRLKVRNAFNQDNKKIADLVRVLGKMLLRYQEKPLFQTDTKRATGRILRDFFTSVNRGDGVAALEYVAELSARQLLSPLNLVSLEFQALAASSRWDEILEDKQRLLDAITGVTSRNVTLVILTALRSTGLKSEVVNTKTREEVEIQYYHLQSLFLKTPDISSNNKEEWMVWSIGAGVFGYDQLQYVLPKYLLDSGWWQRLSDWLVGESIQIVNPLPLTVSLETLVGEHPCEESAARLLTYSVNASDKEKFEICKVLAEYPEPILAETVREKVVFSFLWNALNEHGKEHKISNWTCVFTAMGGEIPVANIQQRLNDCLTDWGKDKWEEGSLDNLIADGNGPGLRNILPQLLPWLVERNIFLSKVNLLGVIENLATDETVSAEDLNLAGDVFSLLSGLPLTPDEYREALDCVDIIWGKVKSRTTINYYLDVVDLMVDGPCADFKRRESIWSDLQEFLIKQWSRLDGPQKLTALALAEELTGTSQQFLSVYAEESLTADIPSIDLSGKTLAIYSLTEGAGKRAASIISTQYPGIEVSLNHDKTATSSLINLAEKMDYFIFVSQSAAHQAFYPVTDKRKDLIYPSGKGSSSIVRAFDERIQATL